MLFRSNLIDSEIADPPLNRTKIFFLAKNHGHYEDIMFSNMKPVALVAPRPKKTVTVRLLEQIKQSWDMSPPHLKAEMYYRGKLLKVFGGYNDLYLTTRAGNWAIREGFTHIIWA